MTDYLQVGELQIARTLHDLVRDEIAPSTSIEPEQVWRVLGEVVSELGPVNRALLERRDALQAELDTWFRERRGQPIDPGEQQAFLEQIGYLVPEGPDFEVSTTHVDPEITRISGPQLVVPADNARYALNAANARWGSLFDALYGTDVLPEDGGATRGAGYNPIRGERVIARANALLDELAPLRADAWGDVMQLTISEGRLECVLEEGQRTSLAHPEQCVGYREAGDVVTHVLLANNDLHIDIQIDPAHPIGQQHQAGIKDVVLESAVSTIVDCEDSVAAADAADKTTIYRNWLGLMKGDLAASIDKGGEQFTRRLSPDRDYTAPDGETVTLHGRSLLLVRNVGHHIYSEIVKTREGEPIPETFIDAVLTTLAGIHDLNNDGAFRNTRAGSIYIVKPKLHGPEEVARSVELFERIEDGFGLARNTLKIGIMDEERRTTVNLKECIRAAAERVIFINTGFLDRTADEIHTTMESGAMMPKPAIKSSRWMLAYEDWNVDVGLACGLRGHAQIGKGMWAMPEEMNAMLEAKIGHPQAGASCAWVPSPTAATLHALHYHRVDVRARQKAIEQREPASLRDLLTPALLDRELTAEEIQRELDNNAQGILGYVVRWVEQGIGCSTVPDISDTGLMEDRATLRISSQHIANWIHQGVTNDQQVVETMQRMAEVVDRQNADDASYRNMAPDFESSLAFQAAMDLVVHGREEPNGYTEPTLMRRRREFKLQQKR